jgi:hypothetical protein
MVEHHEENVRLDGHGNRIPNVNGDNTPSENLEFEVVELRRLNKELQFQKRNLAIKLSSAESKLAGLEKNAEVPLLELYSFYLYFVWKIFQLIFLLCALNTIPRVI